MIKVLGRLYIIVTIIGIAAILYIAFLHYSDQSVTVIGKVRQIQDNRIVTGQKVTLIEMWGRDGRYYTLGLDGVDNDFWDDRKLPQLLAGEIEVTFSKTEIIARSEWKKEFLEKYKLSNPITWWKIKSYKLVNESRH